MPNAEAKKTLLEKFMELFQWIILGGAYLKKTGGGGGGATQNENEGTPTWILSILSPFTDEDEVLYAQLLDTIGDAPQKKIDTFRLEMIRRGWDEDKFRLILVKNFKDALDKKALMKNSATRTLTQIADADGDYAEQERIAHSKKLLIKTSGLKRFLRWSRQHKLETILGLFLAPFVFLKFIFWLIGG